MSVFAKAEKKRATTSQSAKSNKGYKRAKEKKTNMRRTSNDKEEKKKKNAKRPQHFVSNIRCQIRESDRELQMWRLSAESVCECKESVCECMSVCVASFCSRYIKRAAGSVVIGNKCVHEF